MLNLGIRYKSFFIAFILITSCIKNEDEKVKKIIEISKATVGSNEYDHIYKQATDSLRAWDKAKLEGYRWAWDFKYKLDSVLCFNLNGDRMVTAILAQCDLSNCVQDDVHYFYGAKIKRQWYFFSGATMVVPREYYQSDIYTPLSFEKLHELAMKNIFRGYLKKNSKDEWEINDAFFTYQLEDVGWGDFKRQSHKDTLENGKRFTNKKDYFESIYLRQSKEKWLYREK